MPEIVFAKKINAAILYHKRNLILSYSDEEYLCEYDLLPHLKITDVKVLYHSSYYDGPLDGMLEWNGEKYWYLMYRDFPHTMENLESDDEMFDGTRCYVILKLSDEEMEEEAIVHKLWVECCGNGCYDLPEDYKPIKPTKLFYETYPPHLRKEKKGTPIAHLVW